MKIKYCKIKGYNLKLSTPFEYFSAQLNHLPYSLVIISADNGLVGYGEAALSWDITGETQKGAKEIFKYCLPILQNKTIEDLSDIESLMKKINLNISFNTALKSAIEMALLDVLGKYKNKPVYKLFTRANATAIKAQKVFSYTEEDFPNIIPELKKAVASESIIKIKVGKSFNDELEFISKIHRFNKNIPMVLDANQGWEDAKTSLGNIKILSPYKILWIEQPVGHDAIEEFSKLKKQSKIKIMADESCHNLIQLKALMADKCVDYINIKIAKTGGFFEALKMIGYCKKNNIKFMLGDMLYSDLGTAANLHLAQLADYISFDITDPDRIKNSRFSGLENKDNIFKPSSKSGFGVELK